MAPATAVAWRAQSDLFEGSVQMFLRFVELNRRQGGEEWEGRQRAAGFSAAVVSARVKTVDAEGRTRRETVRDPLGIVAAWTEQTTRRGVGVPEEASGGTSLKRKRERIFPKPTVWPWDQG